MLKHIVQGMAMFSDLLILAATLGLIYACLTTGSLFLIIVSAIMLRLTYDTWKSQGGFIAWTKSGRTAFSTGWDKIMSGGS